MRGVVALGWLAAGAAAGGCGSGGPPTVATTVPTAGTASCPAKVAARLGGAATARVVSHEPGLLTCAYAVGATSVRVTFDDEPQAWFRWRRAQVEREQTSFEWSKTPGERPRDVHGVSAGAFWVPRPRQLVASDGRRLLTVTVLRPRSSVAARRLAARLAPTGLGPPHVPAAMGP